MVYNFSNLKKSDLSATPHYLVVGNPVGHSLSPLMHQTAIDYHQLNAVYAGLHLEHNEIAEFAAWCNRENFLGCNITIPYKELFLKLVDRVDNDAQEIGAINTIVKQNGGLTGYNTDIIGFMEPVLDLQHLFEGGRAIVFGTGGASKAVKIGLLKLGVREIVFVSRNPAGKTTSDHRAHIEFVDYHQWQSYAEEAAIFINTTPVGMHPNVDEIFIDRRDATLFEDKICYDLIYNPVMTSFLKEADRAGAVVINGLEMFIQQGNRSFELWTGKTFPVEIIEQKLNHHFHQR
ncbi:MAG: shikimate dehydrogenase [Balneolaceae bacterium]|nr:MAG: shikimate dehydrogenase [Balneolaceae bacterium]